MNTIMSLEPFYQNAMSRRRRKKAIRNMGFIGIGIIFSFFVSCFITFCAPKPVQKISLSKCHEITNLPLRQILMTDYFKRKGNQHPEQMAAAVLATKKPKLMAAIATKGEKNTPYTVRRGGYKKRHAGAFQVSQKDWGFVPYDPVKQALQSERVLEELLEESDGNMKVALNKYGGDKTKKVYAKNILEEIANIP